MSSNTNIIEKCIIIYVTTQQWCGDNDVITFYHILGPGISDYFVSSKISFRISSCTFQITYILKNENDCVC